MPSCVHVSDLHGSEERYRKLFDMVEDETPELLFLGGDLLPHGFGEARTAGQETTDFLGDVIIAGFDRLREKLRKRYPRVLVILGNDDGRAQEGRMEQTQERGLWDYIHGRCVKHGRHVIYGYSFVPPTPFMNKDWERYDVSRYVDPGCVPPEGGRRTSNVSSRSIRQATIAKDLERIAGDHPQRSAIWLFHTPPYKTNLDRAALDGKTVDHAPVDVHVGSIAVQRFVEARQPRVTLHGHVHESARITGSWHDRIGDTPCYTAAHDGPELAAVFFDPDRPDEARRQLL